MPEVTDYKQNLRLLKSLLIVTSLQQRPDDRAFQAVNAYNQPLVWEPLADLMIDDEVWRYATDIRKYEPRFVFCHPDVLIASPEASLYYRGMCGLSLKAAKEYFGAVETLESKGSTAKLKRVKAEQMARTYNTFLCSIIQNSTDWTLENGRRTIIATLGITLDGIMRNRVGDIAEQRVRQMLLEWLIENNLIVEPQVAREQLRETTPDQLQLRNGVTLEHGSEPDISFWRETSGESRELLATVEIKGGTDPAGALERYGAATKSFQHALNLNSRCRNFLLAAVYTDELTARIQQDRLVDHWFDLIEVLENPDIRSRFMDELFNHTLRLV